MILEKSVSYELDHWHGVQGVEYSNHSVPTIFRERPKSKDLGLFRLFGLLSLFQESFAAGLFALVRSATKDK